MAERSTQLVVDALHRAVSDPAGLPLYGSRAKPGLFVAGAAGRQAAERCKAEGYLRIVTTETRGKNTQEICAVTEKGLAYLLGQVDPKQVLEELVRVLQERQAEVGDLLSLSRRMQESLDALRTTAERTLQQLHRPAQAPGNSANGNGSETWTAALLNHLHERQSAGAMDDCPLPDLYRRLRHTAAALTVGQFHDGLRRLYEQEQVYLHPWTGPVYDIPEPGFALLVGHEIAYYVSSRKMVIASERGT